MTFLPQSLLLLDSHKANLAVTTVMVQHNAPYWWHKCALYLQVCSCLNISTFILLLCFWAICIILLN